MKRKRYKRYRRLVAYTLRALVCILLVMMLALMVCGCLYLSECFREEETESSSGHLTLQSGMEDEAQTSSKPRVILDAGHGGRDNGTSHGEILEKEINLSMTQRIGELLEENGVEVIQTRTSDQYLSLSDRTAIANEKGADLFISLHCNYYEDDEDICGVECYYYPTARDSKQSAERIIAALEGCHEVKVRDAREGDFFVLRNTDMAAVLIEAGYLSNGEERRKLSDDGYQELLAAEIAEGILEHLV